MFRFSFLGLSGCVKLEREDVGRGVVGQYASIDKTIQGGFEARVAVAGVGYRVTHYDLNL
jgi:hypothetical protein